MKHIELTRGLVALVDDEDFEWLTQWSWQAFKSKQGTFYARRKQQVGERRFDVWMHREIMEAIHGQIVDHKNRLSLDNQRHNLRIVTQSQNLANQAIHSKNTSGFKGVSWNKWSKSWRADISHGWKRQFLGRFISKEDAARAYDAAAVSIYGDCALTNLLMGNYGKT